MICFKCGSVIKQEMPFKDISIFSFGGHFVHVSKPICAILVDSIMRNITVDLF